MEGNMGDDKDDKKIATWDLPVGDPEEDTLDKSADKALKKVGEPMTTDLGTNFEQSKPVSLDEGDDSVSEDLAFINEQIKKDEAEKKPAEMSKISEPEIPEPFAESKTSAGITFGNSSYENVNKKEDSVADAFEIGQKKEASAAATGTLAELEKKTTDKKAELESSIKKSQGELDKLTEIVSSIKELKQKEADLMEKANNIL
jgi:hypothetical protein